MVFDNFVQLNRNPYPGRGLILGVDETGEYAVQVYWIMGRSENSRKRVFSLDGDRLFTEAVDPAKMENPNLVIYNAMDRFQNTFVVSNGDQTDTVTAFLRIHDRLSLKSALSARQFEPDKPNYTPRITGCTSIAIGRCSNELVLFRRSELVGDPYCVRFYYEYNNIKPGVGFCLTTYMEDGNPLPPFVGEPLAMPLEGSAGYILATYWDALNADNRVSLAVKFINIRTAKSETLIQNRYTKVV